jgi:hypothetical protein
MKERAEKKKKRGGRNAFWVWIWPGDLWTRSSKRKAPPKKKTATTEKEGEKRRGLRFCGFESSNKLFLLRKVWEKRALFCFLFFPFRSSSSLRSFLSSARRKKREGKRKQKNKNTF